MNSFVFRDRDDTVRGTDSRRCCSIVSRGPPQSDEAPLIALGNAEEEASMAESPSSLWPSQSEDAPLIALGNDDE